jgi:hypothetical protein
MILYKYCSAAGLDIVARLRLKVTPPQLLNDPMEWTWFDVDEQEAKFTEWMETSPHPELSKCSW